VDFPLGVDVAAASPDPSATFAGGGAFHADTTVVSPPEPVAGILAASVEPLGMSRIETDYANLLLLAISLEKMARDEIAKLSNERPNDPYTIESNKKQSDLLSILADGFTKIAAALEEYSKDPRPFFAGKAKEIRDWVGAQLKAWWEANEAEARDLCVRLPIFIASIGALNLAGADMHFATAAIGASVGGKNAIAAIKAAWKRHEP
jgi:aldehyde:ferredoxin oxidoreductase